MNDIKLNVGDIVKIGKESSALCGLPVGLTIVLIQGHFDYDNGFYTEDQTAPSIWDEKRNEFDSIYHLFGNKLEDFLDSKVIGNTKKMNKLIEAVKKEAVVEWLEGIKAKCRIPCDLSCKFGSLCYMRAMYWEDDAVQKAAEV